MIWLALPVLIERLANDPVCHPRRIALPCQHANQPSQPDLGRQTRSAGESALDERAGRRELGFRAKLGDSRLNIVPVNATLVQFRSKGTAAKTSAVMPGLDPRIREHRVIDEADLDEP